MRTRHRLLLAALVCAGVGLAAGFVAYLTWPTGASQAATQAVDLAAYAYAGLSGIAGIAALILAGLAERWDPAGASGRCTVCKEPIPTALDFCTNCGRREHPPGA